MIAVKRSIEEIALNAFPAEEVTLYDGWVIRRTQNYPSRRINSVNVMTQPTLETLAHKIDYCETFLSKFQCEIAFKITNMNMHLSLDRLLASKGYKVVTPTNVMTLELDQFAERKTEFYQESFSIKIEQTLSAEWLQAYVAFKEVSAAAQKALMTCLEKIANPVYYLSIYNEHEWVGAGQAVIEDHHVGLFDISVSEPYRCKGIGRIIVETLIQRAKQEGAKSAYLQVVADNEPAKKLYANIGFQEAYQYWYRTK